VRPRWRRSCRRSRGPTRAARAALDDAKLDYELLTFTEADHAFFNDTGARFNPAAAEEVWRRVIGWFSETGRDEH
jgi:carboxymethylenebutenolidase